jgi:hypothetical protein
VNKKWISIFIITANIFAAASAIAEQVAPLQENIFAETSNSPSFQLNQPKKR